MMLLTPPQLARWLPPVRTREELHSILSWASGCVCCSSVQRSCLSSSEHAACFAYEENITYFLVDGIWVSYPTPPFIIQELSAP